MQHQNAVHYKTPCIKTRPRQHPPPQTPSQSNLPQAEGVNSDSELDSASAGTGSASGTTSSDAEPQPIGAYYEIHPVLDGK